MKKINKITFLSLVSLVSLSSCIVKKNTDSRVVKVFINQGNLFDGLSKDSIWKKIEMETSTTLQVTGATHGNDYYMTLNPKLISPRNDIDIVFSVPSNVNCNYENAIDKDMYWNLDELLAMKPGEYPYIEKLISSDLYKNISYGEGAHTIIPYLTSRSGWAIYYRSDWLINIGYYTIDENGEKVARTPVTIEEFEDVCRKFRFNDPDGNGEKDTYAISPAGSYFYWNPLYHAFGVTPSYDLDENNTPTYMYNQEEFKDYLKWINGLYREGIIDPNFNSNSPNEEDRNKFYNGLVGILITNGENHVDWVIPGVEKVQGKNKVVIGSAPIGTSKLGKDGVGGFSDWGGWWGGYSIFKHTIGNYDFDYDSAYASLDVLEYLYSQEGGLLRYYGIENNHWKYNENGEIEPIIYNRYKEDEGTFTVTEDKDGKLTPSGLYKMGATWGNRLNWKEDGTFDVVIESANMPYKLKDVFDETVNKNTVVSSKLTNFTNFASGFASKMKLFESEMERYATAATKNIEEINNWDDEMSKLVNDYKWNKIQKMIKEQAKNCGVI